jgi:PAS domain S-box-containing protein/putative nucleotidyltransferase with HDIG domain
MCRGQASSGERSFVASGNIPIRVLVSSARIKGEDGDDHYLVNWLDITERYQVQEALRESEEKYRSLIENLNEIVYSLNRDGHITFISPLVTSVLGYEPGEMEGHSFTSFVHEKDRVMVEESLKDRWAGITEKYEVRMLDKKGRIHYLFLSSRPQFEGNNVVGAIGAISDITDQREAEIKLEASYKKLDSIMDGTALSMVSLLEIRDPYSAGHQRRVSILATAIAIEMGLPEEQVERIRIASLVHDIGKIHIPSEILSKPSPLRKTEFELLKGHPAAGAEIISRFAFPEDISTIVHQHHERLDGSGYPDGLKGDEILFEARILAVADVVEAMVSHRPYRPAHSFDEALEEISSRSGTLYDPAVVEACVKVFSRKGIFNPDPVM